MRINQQNVEEIFKALDLQIKVNGGFPISLVVCGGTALAALRLVRRTTKDVDVLAKVTISGRKIKIEKINRFPDWFLRAAEVVKRDFNLPDNWINLGPAAQIDSGLPPGFEERLIKRTYGKYLTIYYISRIDQIYFKLYASIDRDSYHIQDLIKLEPSELEIENAAKWLLTQDASIEFRALLKDFIRGIGYGKIADKI